MRYSVSFLLGLLLLILSSCGNQNSQPASYAINDSGKSAAKVVNHTESNLVDDVSGYQELLHSDISLEEKVSVNNSIISRVMVELQKRGQRYEVLTKTVEDAGESAEYLMLKLYSENSTINPETKLDRLAKKMNVKDINLDFVDNARNFTIGTFNPYTRDLAIGSDYIISLLLFDDIGGNARHEFAHAMFTNMKRNGIDSVYHTWFQAEKGKELHDFPSVYKTFISSEELYTNFSQAFWLLKADLDKVYDNRDYVLNKLERRFKFLWYISKQVEDLSRRSLEQIVVENEKVLLNQRVAQLFSNNDYNYFYLVNERYFIRSYSAEFKNALDTHRELTDYIKNNEIDTANFNAANYSNDVISRMNDLNQQIIDHETLMMRELVGDLRALNKLGAFYYEEVDIMKDAVATLKLESRDLTREDFKVKFNEFRKSLRHFMNKGREWHKSFVGLE